MTGPDPCSRAYGDAVKILYSYPNRIGAGRTCYTAWQQVRGLIAAGAEVTVFPGSVFRDLPPEVRVVPTLARGRWRVPYRAIGQARARALHDRIVARRLASLAEQVDIVHAWPQAALQTLRTARRLGVPTVLERPNAHTRFAFEAVRAESQRIGVPLPPGGEHAYDEDILRREEAEFHAADALLCPSEFVVRTFRDQGHPDSQLVRHIYGYDELSFFPPDEPRSPGAPLRVIFVGYAAVRKGLHFALEAWLRSPASREAGTFLIAGDILPTYADKLAEQLAHPSVQALGHRTDVPELVRGCDVLLLPSVEEGFGLVCAEAIGAGCVPLVSDACTDVCRHGENAFVHPVGDVDALEDHLTMLHRDPTLLARLRQGCLRTAPDITWTAAGVRLLEAYEETLARRSVSPRAAA
jgi:glycosyltransferase involved in cell wall biosynthesis